MQGMVGRMIQKAKSIQHLQKVQMVEIHGVNQHYL